MILQTNFNINVLALISCSKGLTQNGNVFLGRLLKGSKKRKKKYLHVVRLRMYLST